MLERARRLLDSLKAASNAVGINRRNAELIYPNNERQNYRFGDDKLLAKERLVEVGVPVPKTLAVCEGLFAVEATLRELSEYSSFVVKPSRASGGAGILVLTERMGEQVWLTAKGTPIEREGLRKHLADIVFGVHGSQLSDRAFAEPLVEPHPRFSALWAGGLCDLRVLTLEGEPFMAMLRIPTLASAGRANLHQGGIGAALDLETGELTRAFWRGRPVVAHPESGVGLTGFVVPRWQEVIRVARLAASAVPLGYLGIDIVLDSSAQALVLEVNVRPGLEIQNIHGRSIDAALEGALRRGTE